MIYTIAEAAVQSLIKEVRTSPKPGLVDLFSNGSHTDMNIQTFMDSAQALFPYFIDITKTAASWENSLPALFMQIRKRGIAAEQEMFAATNGINTHKGLIFSEGILAASASYCWTHFATLNSAAIFSTAKNMVYTILEDDFLKINRTFPQTHGEKLFVQYGYKGIRGEAQNGFPLVRSISLPALTKYLQQGKDENLSRVQTLFLLMEVMDDTNVLHRCGRGTLLFVKEKAAEALQKGGAFTDKGLAFINSLDSIFIERNISSGGCADLLAITILMQNLHRIVPGSFQKEIQPNSIIQQRYSCASAR